MASNASAPGRWSPGRWSPHYVGYDKQDNYIDGATIIRWINEDALIQPYNGFTMQDVLNLIKRHTGLQGNYLLVPISEPHKRYDGVLIEKANG